MQARLLSPDLDALELALRVAPSRLISELGPVANRAGMKIKRDIQKNATGHRRLPHLGRAVEYDVTQTAASVEVEVGFKKAGQGNLANIAVYGSEDTAPFVDIDTPLQSEVKPFMDWVARVAAKI